MSLVLATIFAALTLAALAYQLLALGCLGRFCRRPLPSPALPPLPGITLLKPVKGCDTQTYACLASFLEQDYPTFQVLFGVADLHDPVVPLLHRLQADFPAGDIEIVHCPQSLGLNPKISSLCQMLPRARYDLLVISDSDIAVPPTYLHILAAALADPQVGLVTLPYRGGPAATLGAALETLSIGSDFIPSVAVAYYLEGISFGLGATMALRRPVLEAIGGLAPLADYLADDYQLGYRIHQAGYQVTLLPYVVATVTPRETLRGYLAHQLRWTRTYRICRPAGYFAYGITFALPPALLAAWLLGPGILGGSLVLTALVIRLTVAYVSHWLFLGGNLSLKYLALLPLKDLLAFLLWCLSFLGDRVRWKERLYRVRRDGKLVVQET